MCDIAPHLYGLCRIVVPGEISLIFRDAVRQVGGPERDLLLPQMVLVPGQGVVVEGISAIQVLRRICVEQVEHEEDVLHILLVKHGQKMRLLLVREQIPDGPDRLRAFADHRDHEELGHDALREEETGFPVGVKVRELLHEGFHVRVFRERPGLLNPLHRLIPVGKIRPGQLYKEPVILILRVLLPDRLIVLLPGFMLLYELLHRGEGCHFMVLRVTLPEH